MTNSCSFDLYDGRKPVGGKVEAKLRWDDSCQDDDWLLCRIRNPILAKQIEQKQEKWLVVQF